MSISNIFARTLEEDELIKKAPELLVLDEPCQGLDAQNRARVIRTVETIGQHLNITLIYVTHEWETLPETITHRMQLKEGKIVERGVGGRE